MSALHVNLPCPNKIICLDIIKAANMISQFVLVFYTNISSWWQHGEVLECTCMHVSTAVAAYKLFLDDFTW